MGLLFRGAQLGRYWRENAISFAYRSTVYPLYYAGLAWLCGLGPLDARVLTLYGLVPSGLLSNYLAVSFELDTELTSSVFVVSTVTFLVAVLPVLRVLVVTSLAAARTAARLEQLGDQTRPASLVRRATPRPLSP